jgi:hypothetical protein
MRIIEENNLKEYNILIANNIWKLMLLPKSKKVIRGK